MNASVSIAGLPHLRMAAAGHGVSAFSLAPALGMGCAAGALAGISRMPTSKSSSLCMSSGGIGGGSISGKASNVAVFEC